MPKMSEQAKRNPKSQAYQKSREKRVQEVAAAQSTEVVSKPSSAPNDSSTDSPGLTVARHVGRPPSEKTAKMVIVMEPELRLKLKTYCALYDTTAADVIDNLVRTFLNGVELPIPYASEKTLKEK